MPETLAQWYSSESYPMNTTWQGLDVFQKSLLWKKVAFELEGLRKALSDINTP